MIIFDLSVEDLKCSLPHVKDLPTAQFLIIIDSMIKKHGLEIVVERTEGEISTFRVRPYCTENELEKDAKRVDSQEFIEKVLKSGDKEDKNGSCKP